MKRTFPATFQTKYDDFWHDACMLLPSDKEAHELRDAFDVLQIWQAHFHRQFGDLQAITHHSNPDDPPDVVAQFSQGCLDIELTIIDPPHIMQAEAIHKKYGGGARTIPAVSYQPTGKQEIIEIMKNPSHPRAWEKVSDQLAARADLIVAAFAKKVKKHPSGGLLILQGGIEGDQFDRPMLREVFEHVCALPGAVNWTIAVIYRWNSHGYFSALWSQESGMKTSREFYDHNSEQYKRELTGESGRSTI